MTVTVTPTVELTNVPPRVRLDVSASAGETTTTVTRQDPDGSTVIVRTSDGNPQPISGGVALLYDPEMGYGQSVTYSSLESPAVVSAPVTVNETRVWLVHPGVPALSVPVAAAGISARTRVVQRALHWPAGRKSPIPWTDGQRKAPAYTLTIRTTTDADRAAINALIDDAGVLLLNVPATKGWGVTAEYVSVGDTVEDRLLQFGPEQRRHWPLPLQVVDRPAGGSQSQRTLADLLVYPTLADLKAAYPTLLALLSGP